jgi:ketosteroid isomerase-like protein
MDIQQSFFEFMKQREAAAKAYVNGKAGPLREVTSHGLVSTFFAPRGGEVTGANQVWSRYERDAGSFQSGGETRFEVLQLAEAADMAYWVGFQHATVRMTGSPHPTPMSLRVTEVFRREAGSWKLVHRHADTLTQAS